MVSDCIINTSVLNNELQVQIYATYSVKYLQWCYMIIYIY